MIMPMRLIPAERRGRLRLSLAHDYLLVPRGAERTFAAIADLSPDAPIFTLLYDENARTGTSRDDR